MNVFHSIVEAQGLSGAAVCLGNFDGVHLGHQALFARARAVGPAVALTFQPHPGKVLQPALAPKLITLLPRKLELLADQGLVATVVQPFSVEYARSSPAAFEASLFEALGAKAVVVGTDFTYGAGRSGTLETLREAARARGASVEGVSPVTAEGVVVSSSRIREYLLEGRVSAAHRLLGYPFDLSGLVVPGQGRGRTIGVPTANVDTANELRPGAGVYAVRARVLRGGAAEAASLEGPRFVPAGSAGPWLPGAANIGVKPTFGGGAVTIEVHLLDFQGDLYGKELRVQFLERLRAEKRFASATELLGQIKRDLEEARNVVARAVD